MSNPGVPKITCPLVVSILAVVAENHSVTIETPAESLRIGLFFKEIGGSGRFICDGLIYSILRIRVDCVLKLFI